MGGREGRGRADSVTRGRKEETKERERERDRQGRETDGRAAEPAAVIPKYAPPVHVSGSESWAQSLPAGKAESPGGHCLGPDSAAAPPPRPPARRSFSRSRAFSWQPSLHTPARAHTRAHIHTYIHTHTHTHTHTHARTHVCTHSPPTHPLTFPCLSLVQLFDPNRPHTALLVRQCHDMAWHEPFLCNSVEREERRKRRDHGVDG